MVKDTEARLHEVIELHGSALQRLARSYEQDPSLQQDLVQEILIAIARALPTFEERSSLRTFVFRIAHNIGISHSVRGSRRRHTRWTSIDDLASEPISLELRADAVIDQQQRLARLKALVASLKPVDRQLVLLLLEGLPASEIAEVTGLSPTNVTTKLSRIRSVLKQRLEGEA
jgi:RNA polymerase sigma-70 factor (ECF subfamily)